MNPIPKAAILDEKKSSLNLDGMFDTAYEQEDGMQFTEDPDTDGNRHGSYRNVYPSSQRHTVTYIAGKNGFQPIGDYIPAIPIVTNHSITPPAAS